MKHKIGLSLLLVLAISTSIRAQVHSFDVGIRFQKSIGLYYENGITINYNLTTRWVLGTNFVTSRLGSAISTNAIKQDNIFASVAYKLRPAKSFQPFARLNVGYFTADYEDPVFKSLTHNSMITSLDVGVSYSFKFPVKINGSLGYNIITGDGKTGAGTLYPVFYQLSITYNLAKLFNK